MIYGISLNYGILESLGLGLFCLPRVYTGGTHSPKSDHAKLYTTRNPHTPSSRIPELRQQAKLDTFTLSIP